MIKGDNMESIDLLQGKEIVVEVRKDGTLFPICNLERSPRQSVRTSERSALDDKAKDGRTYLTVEILSDAKTVKVVHKIKY